jgi:hypothetical protein
LTYLDELLLLPVEVAKEDRGGFGLREEREKGEFGFFKHAHASYRCLEAIQA